MGLFLLLAGPAAGQWPLPSTEREVKVDMVTASGGGQAGGTLVLKPSTVSVQARGLKPGGTYSVWLVRDAPYEKQGLGPRPYSFQATSDGTGSFVARLSGSERREWQWVQVIYHPGGDPEDGRDVKSVLRARLPR